MADQPDPEERRRMFMALQTVIAGENAVVGVAALSDALGAVIAFLCDDQAEAHAFCRTLIEDINRDITVNWQESREARGQALVNARYQ